MSSNRNYFKGFTVVIFSLLVGACFHDDDDDAIGCNNSSDYLEFECINRNDFKSADGTSTPESQNIANCTILASTDPFCDLNTLSFIAAESTAPTKEQIMSRVIVSHTWMAENFSDMLDAMPADMKTDMYNLFASVTAIVIHDEIRPAFFWGGTGAIYLDPYYLWTTQAQYNTISNDPDFRSDFGAKLGYMSFSRYTNNGVYAFGSGNTRTETQTLHALSALLFHELAHARDAFPVSGIVAAAGNLTPGNIAETLAPASVSENLQANFPLQDDTLFDLANVLYRGFDPYAFLISLTATEVGSLFEADAANDDYAYSSIYEDTAMLFEEVMMKIHFDIDREIAFVTPLNDNLGSCADFSFDWTYINRFADVTVIPRVTYVVDGLLPGHGHTSWLNNPVADGVYNWCDSITPYPVMHTLANRTNLHRWH
jgi:hypothetical protein